MRRHGRLFEQKHVLVAPKMSFNVPYRNHFRIIHLPVAPVLQTVFERIEQLLDSYATGRGRANLSVVASAAASNRAVGLFFIR